MIRKPICGPALQIQERGYAEPYQQSGKAITLVGINFDTTDRAIAGWQTKTL